MLTSESTKTWRSSEICWHSKSFSNRIRNMAWMDPRNPEMFHGFSSPNSHGMEPYFHHWWDDNMIISFFLLSQKWAFFGMPATFVNEMNDMNMNHEWDKKNYTSINPKQHQSMLPRRSCAIQNSLIISIVTHLHSLLISKFIGQRWNRKRNTRSLSRNGTMQSWWNKTVFLRKWKEGRRKDISTGTRAGTRKNQEIKMEQNPLPDKRKKGDKHRNQNRNQKEPGNHDGTQPHFLKKERRDKKGDNHPNLSRNQEQPANHNGTEPLSWEKKEERRRETSTGTRAGTTRNQEIMVEQNAIPEKRKREKGNKHLNPSRNQKESGHHDGTEPLSEEKKEERRRETSTGTPAGTRKNHEITPEKSKKKTEGRQALEPEPEPGGTRTMMEQTPFPEKGKKREEGRQAPEPEPEPEGTRKSWWNTTPFPEKRKKR